jgi:hypothetical protein
MPSKCTKCNRSRRGHPILIDDECVEANNEGRYDENSNDSEVEVEADEEDPLPKPNQAHETSNPGPGPIPSIKPPGNKKSPKKKTDQAFAMREILVQLGHLTGAVQKVAADTANLQSNQSQYHAEFITLRHSLTGIPATAPRPDPVTPNMPTDGGATGGQPPTRQDNTGDTPALTPGILNQTLDLSIPLPNGARISKKVYLAARAAEFVNLAEFAPNSEPSSIMESVVDDATGQLVFRNKNVKKAIDNFLSWSRAWAGYESLLMSMNSKPHQGLADYRMFTQGCDAMYHWAAVTSYDQRHRHRLSLSHSLAFDHCSTDIYVCTMNANTIRPNPKACYVCGSIDHHMKDCPFQKSPAKSQTQTQPQKKNFNQSNSYSKPNPSSNFSPRSEAQAYSGDGRQVICFNWNSGRCTSTACWRTHVCSGCGGPEPRFQCTRCNTTKG